MQAARFMGVPGWQIIFRHILPNMASLLIIDATINVSSLILAEVGLSFFGFGVQPPDVSLGTLIGDYAGAALTYPWEFYFPAGFLVVLVLAINLVGDGLRDAFDPNAAGPDRMRRDAATRRVGAAAPRVDDLSVTFSSEAGPVTAVRSLSYQVQPGEVLGIVGESGSGKSVSSLADHGAAAAARARHRLGALSRRGTDRPLRRGAVGHPRPQDLDDLPGSAVGAHAGLHRRRSDRRGDPRARGRRPRGGASARAIDLLALVGIPNPRAAGDRVPARVLRRHAAARDDRDGDRERSGSDHRRRADDRARRDDPGADPRGAADRAEGDRRRHHPDHPRPRRRSPASPIASP